MIVVICFTALIIYCTAKQVSRPMEDARKNLDKIVRDLGAPKMHKQNFTHVHSGVGREMNEFAQGQQQFIDYIEKQRENATAEPIVNNPWYGGNNMKFFSVIPITNVFPDNHVQPFEHHFGEVKEIEKVKEIEEVKEIKEVHEAYNVSVPQPLAYFANSIVPDQDIQKPPNNKTKVVAI